MNSHSKIDATLSFSFIYLREKGNVKDPSQKIEFPNSYEELFKNAKKLFKDKFIVKALYTETGELIHDLNKINPGSTVLASPQNSDNERQPSPVHTPRKSPTVKSSRKSSNETFNKFFGISDSNEIGQLDVVSEVDTLSFNPDLSKEFENETKNKYTPHAKIDQNSLEPNDSQNSTQTTPANINSQSSKITPQSSKITSQGSKITPQSSKITPQNSKITPQNSKITPQNSKITPQNSKLTPQNSKLTPQNSKLTPQNSKITPQNSKITPQNSKITPQSSEPAPQNTKTTPQSSKPTPQNSKISPQRSKPVFQQLKITPQSSQSTKSNLKKSPSAPIKYEKKTTIAEPTEEVTSNDNPTEAIQDTNATQIPQAKSSHAKKSTIQGQQTYSTLAMKNSNIPSKAQSKSNRIQQSGSIPSKMKMNRNLDKSTDQPSILSLSKSQRQYAADDDDENDSNDFSDDIIQEYSTNKPKEQKMNSNSNFKKNSKKEYNELDNDEDIENRKRVRKHSPKKSGHSDSHTINVNNGDDDEYNEYHDYDDDEYIRSKKIRKTKKLEPKPIETDSKKPQPGDINYVNENEYKSISSQMTDALGSNLTENIQNTFSDLYSKDPSISEFLAKAPRLEILQRKDWINSCINSANESLIPVPAFRHSENESNLDHAISEDEIYGLKEMTESCRAFFAKTKKNYKRAVVLGPNGSGKTTFLGILVREALLELSAEEEWKNTFIVFFDIHAQLLALESMNLSNFLQVISSETFRALSNSRPNFRKYEHDVNHVISNLFESNQQLPKSFLADQDFKLLIPPFNSIINEFKDLLKYPENFNDALLHILYLPIKIAEAANFERILIVADDFDCSSIPIVPMPPFDSSSLGVIYQDSLCKLFSRCNFLISCKDQQGLSTIPLQNYHILTTFGIIKSKSEGEDQNGNEEDEKEGKKEFVVEFEGRKEKFIMGKELCGGVPRYLKLWYDIVEAYNSYNEADEDAEENLILIISYAQDLINEIIQSEESLTVINITMK